MHVHLFSEMPPRIAGYGGFRGSRAFAYLPEARVFGFVRRTSLDGLVSHEMAHGFHYRHGTAMKQAGRRAARQFKARLDGADRIPEGDRFRPFLEAITDGRIAADLEFVDPAHLMVEEKEGATDDDSEGDGIVEGDDSRTGEDEVLSWYLRRRFGRDAVDRWRRHRPTWFWLLTTLGYSDGEIEAAILTHVTGGQHAWLARLRGHAAHDARVLRAAADLASPPVRVAWVKDRRRILRKWASFDPAAERDLAARLVEMRAELGSRRARVEVLMAVAAERLRRGGSAEARASLVEALDEARREGAGELRTALDAAVALWAGR